MAIAGRAGTLAMAADWQGAMARARANAPFLAGALERLPEIAAMLEPGDGEGALAAARALRDDEDLARGLRRERLGHALVLAVGDLAGAFPLARVTGELSALADRSLDSAMREAVARRVEGADATGFIALALGKHGARELNYSSDIDPILLYDPATLPRRERDEPGEAAQRYAREVVRLLAENTSDGYVFRIDLRLRPASEVSPLALSVNAALSHYETSALAWERAAFIRARACAGDVAAGEAFLDAIRPFVWRRSLDFGAIEEIGRLTARIRETYTGPLTPQPGYNLKQGRGGIREVEFFAQTHQLIHGGRDRSLRVRGVCETLDALATAGLIDGEDCTVLKRSYERLRTVEHRLQMVEDQQTHTLPGSEALDRVARLDGLADGAALLADLAQVTEAVAARFDRLIAVEGKTVPAAAAPLPERLAELGYADAEALAERIAGWGEGNMRALRSASARAAFEALQPRLLAAIAEAPEPEAALLRWERLLENASSAINLFRLLDARPALLDQLVKLLSLAPLLADALARRPALLDTLIDRSALDLPGPVDELREKMERAERADGYEQRLDRIRVVTGEARFAMGVQLIEAAHDPLAIARGLSRCAEAALQVALDAASAEFAREYGRIAGGELVVLGLGRLGGGLLTHASDLDIIYLFTGPHDVESDGRRPLGATLYFNRLAQRVGAALSVPTAEGALYEVDTRLRPQGAQGPLAVNVESFARYQREDAWTWEHMALTRARVLAGSDAARAEIDEVIDAVLNRPRDAATLRADVLKMRGDMAANKPPRGPLDAKLLRGGLVDLEFLVHYLQLRERAAFDPDLGRAVDGLIAAGLLDPAMREAHDLLTRMLVATRLLAPDLEPSPAAAGAVLALACGHASIDALLQACTKARHGVAAEWRRHFDSELEMDNE
jgi:glutamate-ammonia-ligase adenylyltransferase